LESSEPEALAQLELSNVFLSESNLPMWDFMLNSGLSSAMQQCVMRNHQLLSSVFRIRSVQLHFGFLKVGETDYGVNLIGLRFFDIDANLLRGVGRQY
jgi:hypothetical protein